MNKTYSLFILSLLISLACKTQAQEVYTSSSLRIEQITKSTFRHITYLQTRSFGLYPCNGLVVISDGESMVFDTPSYDSVAVELIYWLENDKKTKIKGIVINHAHVDCLGGLSSFHEKGIPSYASEISVNKAILDNAIIPQLAFKEKQKLKVGKLTVVNQYLGKAHTEGNIVSYIRHEGVLFGGCMLKSINATKGNLNDASVQDWPNTIRKVKKQFPNIEYAVPGHGKEGGMELLDYTINLFDQ